MSRCPQCDAHRSTPTSCAACGTTELSADRGVWIPLVPRLAWRLPDDRPMLRALAKARRGGPLLLGGHGGIQRSVLAVLVPDTPAPPPPSTRAMLIDNIDQSDVLGASAVLILLSASQLLSLQERTRLAPLMPWLGHRGAVVLGDIEGLDTLERTEALGRLDRWQHRHGTRLPVFALAEPLDPSHDVRPISALPRWVDGRPSGWSDLRRVLQARIAAAPPPTPPVLPTAAQIDEQLVRAHQQAITVGEAHLMSGLSPSPETPAALVEAMASLTQAAAQQATDALSTALSTGPVGALWARVSAPEPIHPVLDGPPPPRAARPTGTLAAGAGAILGLLMVPLGSPTVAALGLGLTVGSVVTARRLQREGVSEEDDEQAILEWHAGLMDQCRGALHHSVDTTIRALGTALHHLRGRIESAREALHDDHLARAIDRVDTGEHP